MKRYADKPFAMLGVNSDDPSRLKSILDAKTVTWKNWADGPRGPIAVQWHIQSIPTIYVLDQKGVIRYKNVRGKELEEAVAKLLGDEGTPSDKAENEAKSSLAARAPWQEAGGRIGQGELVAGWQETGCRQDAFRQWTSNDRHADQQNHRFP